MISQFNTPQDIIIKYRQDNVKNYMSPRLQDVKPHFHYHYEILFVTDGSADFTINQKDYHIRKGTLLFISNLERHSISAKSAVYNRYSLLISNEFLSAFIKSPIILSIFKQRPENFCHHYKCNSSEFSYVNHLFELILHEASNQEDFWDSMVSNKIQDLLIFLYREYPALFPASTQRQDQNVILKIQTYIENHLDEKLSLDDIAETFFINKFYLSHIFKKITGYNFKEFITLTRISKSKELLLNTSDSIKSISNAVGFPNASHFIRVFKITVEISPLQYRKKHL